jgi:hypothetical protein
MAKGYWIARVDVKNEGASNLTQRQTARFSKNSRAALWCSATSLTLWKDIAGRAMS